MNGTKNALTTGLGVNQDFMKKFNAYKILLACSVIFLLLFLYFASIGKIDNSGPLLVAFFLTLAISVRGFSSFKSLSYTIWIFTAVAASMYYPEYFTSLGNFQFKILIVPLLQIIMFGMGSQMSLNDFTGVIKMPKGVIIGVSLQFFIMPLVAVAISMIFNFPPEIAAGIILVGCVPSGLASNVMSYIARANLALSVTITAISTLLSPFTTPFLMKLLGGQFIEVNFWSMMLDILNMIILPIVAGFIFNLFNSGKEKSRTKVIQLGVFFIIILLTNLVFMKAKQADFTAFLFAFLKSLGWFFFLPMVGALILRHFLKGEKDIMDKILSLLSMIGIAVIITIITASGRDSLLQVGALLMLTSLLHNVSGYSLGYFISWLLGMPEKDRRTIALEVGMQNGGLASGLALQMGKIATVGLAPAIFGPLMNITGSALASWWRSKPPKTDDEQD
jgi:BASS family bile acid:Na+ symporter